MSAAASQAGDPAPFPDRGARVLLDGLPGGPWTTVVEWLDGSMLAIAPPRLGGEVVTLPLGLPFIVAYSSREVPCEVDAQLVERPAPGGRDTYTARLLGEGRRTQRRGTVRVSVHLIVQATLGGRRAVSTGAITENLSAGGALLRVKEAIDVGAELTTTVLCGGDAGAIEIAGRVVRCDRVDAEERPFRVAIAFDDLSRPDEDRLVRFIFERQRQMRRRATGVA